ncbi:MAG: aldo/keto reductase [Burkholderiaceae bacterium]
MTKTRILKADIPRDRTRRVCLATLGSLASLGALAALPSAIGATPAPGQLEKRIPSTGERIAPIGMGTWITFNVGRDEQARQARLNVLREFFSAGGGMVDSSPMYGSAQEVMGDLLTRLDRPSELFSATKVWTNSAADGREQIEDARQLWGIDRFDLYQVHNLLNWEAHLPHLQALKQAGQLRYVGITTSHGRRHEELAQIIEQQAIDFVQLTYNPLDPEAESRLLPLAKDKGVAVIVNRPFQRGSLTQRLDGKPLPPIAAELGCDSWAQLLLKWVVAHPAVTCVIPATSQVAHMRENMAAGHGEMPTAAQRELIAQAVRGA